MGQHRYRTFPSLLNILLDSAAAHVYTTELSSHVVMYISSCFILTYGWAYTIVKQPQISHSFAGLVFYPLHLVEKETDPKVKRPDC